MQRTLFLIPHQWLGLPVFGWGWALGLLVAAAVVSLVALLVNHSRQSSGDATSSARDESSRTYSAANSLPAMLNAWAPMWAIAAVLVVFVVPQLELVGPTGNPVGVAIRGYGMFLMLAAITSVGLAAWRSHLAGLGSDLVFQIAPITLVGGMIGARVFYVAQYYRDFIRDSWWETLLAMGALTQGGLVVYGAFIGGFMAASWALARRGAPFWVMGDVIIPCVFIGLALGRLGCLMNGCCYGGSTCDESALTVRFPPGSPVYVDQMLSGELLGMVAHPSTKLEANERSSERRVVVDDVLAEGLAAKSGIQAGDELMLALQSGEVESADPNRPSEEILPGLAVLRDGRLLAQFSADRLPPSAGPVWATQLVSSVLATIALITLIVLERVLRTAPFYRSGMLMLIGFMAYATIRFVLEWLRVDELGQFGTSLSISQWVSVVVFLISATALVFRWRSPRGAESPPSLANDRSAVAAG